MISSKTLSKQHWVVPRWPVVGTEVSGDFYGPGYPAMIDSYNSDNGPYRFVANTPSDPEYGNSHNRNVQIGSALATFMGEVWDNVATNGGTVVRASQIHGTIDNNVPVNIPPFKLPTSLPIPPLNPPALQHYHHPNPQWVLLLPSLYVLSSLTSSKLTINALGAAVTFVAVHVTGDITQKITIGPTSIFSSTSTATSM